MLFGLVDPDISGYNALRFYIRVIVVVNRVFGVD
jgi:hypothetical protein